MKKLIIFLLIIIFCITSIVSAANIIDVPITVTPTAVTVRTTSTPVPTPTITLEKYSEEFYGEITYMDGSPVKAGNTILAKDQYGNLLGHYTIGEDGIYGTTKAKPRDPNMIVSVFKDPTNRSSRDALIFVNFFVGNDRMKTTVEFKAGDIVKLDIIIPVAAPTPIPTATPTPLPTIATITTTVVPTTIITTIPTTQPSIIDKIFSPNESDNMYLLYGLLMGGLIITGILIVGIVQSYLMGKSSRDDVLGPEDTNK